MLIFNALASKHKTRTQEPRFVRLIFKIWIVTKLMKQKSNASFIILCTFNYYTLAGCRHSLNALTEYWNYKLFEYDREMRKIKKKNGKRNENILYKRCVDSWRCDQITMYRRNESQNMCPVNPIHNAIYHLILHYILLLNMNFRFYRRHIHVSSFFLQLIKIDGWLNNFESFFCNDSYPIITSHLTYKACAETYFDLSYFGFYFIFFPLTFC